jgi:plasmid stabilization system protein ParE
LIRVQLAKSAADGLDRLIRSHSLPKDTKQRLKRSLRPLGRFPRLGSELAGRWSGFRFVLGPWRWMIVVYAYIEEDERVVIVTIQDARSSLAVRSNPRG